MIPKINYTGVQTSYNINSPINLTPTNTGGAITPKLRIATVSGNSNNMDYPKDGAAQVATYKFPNSVSAKADGTIVVIDDWSQTIRTINPSGVSSTIAGKYEVIGGVVQTGYVDAQGSNARFNTPKAAAYDSAGNIIVLDTYNYRIRKVDSAGNVTTIAGSGIKGTADGTNLTAQFSLLNSLWIDNQGNIFVTDNFRVRKISTTGVVTTIAGGLVKGNSNGNGVTALFRCMRGITGDNQGNLYVSDTDNNSIRKIDSLGNVTTVAFGIAATGIVYYNGLIYVNDYISNQIKTVTLSGVVSIYVGSGLGQFKDGFDTRASKGAALYAPEGLTIDGSGANLIVYVADKNSMKIRKVDNANFTVTPDLPVGMSLDATTGVISGTPINTQPLKIYTVSYGNAEGIASTIVAFAVV